MRKTAASHAIIRHVRKSSTADAATGYLSMVKGLQIILKVHASREIKCALPTVNLDRLGTTSVG